MNRSVLALCLLASSCAGLHIAKQAAESVIEKEARDSVRPDLFAIRETMKATSFRMDLLTDKLESVASEFSTFNSGMKHLSKEINKYIVDAEREHSKTEKRLTLLEKRLKVDDK